MLNLWGQRPVCILKNVPGASHERGKEMAVMLLQHNVKQTTGFELLTTGMRCNGRVQRRLMAAGVGGCNNQAIS